ncbi:hypothetical protein HN51_040471 [Arachis hypogaea]
MNRFSASSHEPRRGSKLDLPYVVRYAYDNCSIIPALMHRIPSELRSAIIPALMHRIPSEIRNSACLGKSSTTMGDLLGRLRSSTYPTSRDKLMIIMCAYFNRCDHTSTNAPDPIKTP